MKYTIQNNPFQSGLNSYVRTGLTLIFWFTTITVSTTRSFRIDTLREDEARLTFTYILLYVVRYHVRIPTSWTVYTVADLYSVCIRPTIALESCTYKIMFVNSLIQGSNPKWNEWRSEMNYNSCRINHTRTDRWHNRLIGILRSSWKRIWLNVHHRHAY